MKEVRKMVCLCEDCRKRVVRKLHENRLARRNALLEKASKKEEDKNGKEEKKPEWIPAVTFETEKDGEACMYAQLKREGENGTELAIASDCGCEDAIEGEEKVEVEGHELCIMMIGGRSIIDRVWEGILDEAEEEDEDEDLLDEDEEALEEDEDLLDEDEEALEEDEDLLDEDEEALEEDEDLLDEDEEALEEDEDLLDEDEEALEEDEDLLDEDEEALEEDEDLLDEDEEALEEDEDLLDEDEEALEEDEDLLGEDEEALEEDEETEEAEEKNESLSSDARVGTMSLGELHDRIESEGVLIVSSGTLKSEDLLGSFLKFVVRENEGILDLKAKECGFEDINDAIEVAGTVSRTGSASERLEDLVDGLIDILDDESPEGFSFHTSEGDGAEFGWFAVEDV